MGHHHVRNFEVLWVLEQSAASEYSECICLTNLLSRLIGRKKKKLGAFPSLVNGSCKLFHCVTISSDVYDVITLFTTKGKHWPFRPHSYCAISLHQKQQQQNARTRRVVFNGAIDSQWTPAPGREVMLWVSLNSHGCNIRSQQSACQDCHCVFVLL